MFGPMRSEPVNLPSWGLRAGYESSSFIESIFPPSFSYLGMDQGPCLIFFLFFLFFLAVQRKRVRQRKGRL